MINYLSAEELQKLSKYGRIDYCYDYVNKSSHLVLDLKFLENFTNITRK